MSTVVTILKSKTKSINNNLQVCLHSSSWGTFWAATPYSLFKVHVNLKYIAYP